MNFHRISNSIEICLVGRAPGRGTEMEGVGDRDCHWKGPESPGRDEGGKGAEGVGGIG